jgi:hypothetical protein
MNVLSKVSSAIPVCSSKLGTCALIAVLTVSGTTAGPGEVPGAFESADAPVPVTPIDRLVTAKLAKLGIQPVLCSDAVFVRRVYLDVTGTLPSAEEAREFIRDSNLANKRAKLIDRLLDRDEYADYWAMRWGDVLRIKAEFPVNLWPNAAQAYHRWLRSSLASNKPYDQFVRELLTSSGSNFRVGPVNFYRAIQNRKPDGIAAAVALTFLGARAELWPAPRREGLAAFFSQLGYKPSSEWKEEHVFWDPMGICATAGNTAPGRAALVPPDGAPAPVPPPVLTSAARPRMACFPDDKKIELPANRDPRDVFADWLLARNNPWFARNIVNRYWAWLLGRGIIHEPDDIRPDNAPCNPELLAYLERELIAAHYDLKHLCRIILNSRTYQFSPMPRSQTAEAKANFSSYPLRRLDAEVLIDAINQITGASDLYTSAIPEPFTYIPQDQSAVSLPDGSITSPFLALFGRSARATGMFRERDNKPVPAQWLYLLNSSHIQRKLEQSTKLKAILDPSRKPAAIIEDLYLTIFSRFPTEQEIQTIGAYGKEVPGKPAVAAGPGKPAQAATPAVVVKRREDWLDLAWSLINSTEFLYLH